MKQRLTAKINGSGEEFLPQDGSARLFGDALARPVADALFARLTQTIPWQSEIATIIGRRIPLPRLTAWHGDRPYRYSGITHQPSPWTEDLLAIKHLAETVANTSFNSVLLNLYRDGRDSMGWHSDDEHELGPEPVIASISLGAVRNFQLRHRHDKPLRVTLPLPHGSCLVMAGKIQKYWQHQVPKTSRPVGPRINMTFRQILS